MTETKVAVYGSGRTATELVKAIEHSPHRLVSGIVHSAERVGRDYGEITTGAASGFAATGDLEAAIRSGTFDVLLYAGITGEIHDQAMELCADEGIDLVHACFVEPAIACEPALLERITVAAGRSGARIVGTGMIPGLWLDVLPSLLTSALPAPVTIEGERQSDIASWGGDVLRQELGVGTTASGPSPRLDVLLKEMATMIARVLGVRDAVVETRGGVVHAQQARRVGSIDVSVGEVEGFRQSAVVIADGVVRVDIAWSGFADIAERSVGSPVRLRLTGGDGSTATLDIAPPVDPYPGTAARMVHAIGAMRHLPPGMHAPTDLAVA